MPYFSKQFEGAFQNWYEGLNQNWCEGSYQKWGEGPKQNWWPCGVKSELWNETSSFLNFCYFIILRGQNRNDIKRGHISELHQNAFIYNCLPQAFSSEPSLQSFFPLQKRPLPIQLPSPHAKKFSWQMGSSVKRRGLTFLSLVFSSQFLTEAFQLHVCFSMSKARPAGHLMACRP